MKVLSIIGIVLSAIMVFATFLVVKSNGRMSIEESAPWIFIYVNIFNCWNCKKF